MCLDWIMIECLNFFKKKCCLSCWLDFQIKLLKELWLGIRIAFPTIPDAILNVLLFLSTMYLWEAMFLASAIIKSKYWPILETLKKLHALRYQTFSQELFNYVKTNTSMQICLNLLTKDKLHICPRTVSKYISLWFISRKCLICIPFSYVYMPGVM